MKQPTTYAFIDAANLFYGGEKSLGWKVDYKKLLADLREIDHFDRAVVLSGDGDFLPVLRHLKAAGKGVVILARGPRTAKVIRRFAGGDFRDFVRLETSLKFQEKQAK